MSSVLPHCFEVKLLCNQCFGRLVWTPKLQMFSDLQQQGDDWITCLVIPGSPYRGQNWRIGKLTFLGSKDAFFGGPPWNHLNWLFGAFYFLPQYKILFQGEKNAPKAHLNGSKKDLQKRNFSTPKLSFSRFSNFDLCRGTLGSQNLPDVSKAGIPST